MSEGICELDVLDGLPSKVMLMLNSDDPRNSFRTRNTFVPHPSTPKAQKYLGRLDDYFKLMRCEKVLPVLTSTACVRTSWCRTVWSLAWVAYSLVC
jgi:hypothetical protein